MARQGFADHLVCLRVELAKSVVTPLRLESCVTSSPPMVNLTTRRGAATMQSLVSRITKPSEQHRRRKESRSNDRFHGICVLAL